MQVDEAYRARVRAVVFRMLLRRSGPSTLLMILCAMFFTFAAGQSGQWMWAVFAIALIVLVPLSWWRTSTRLAAQLPLGSWIAYAVTPDGGFHASTLVGTTTINPGYVRGVQLVGDCWLLGSSTTGSLIVVPRELLPDADAARLRQGVPAGGRS